MSQSVSQSVNQSVSIQQPRFCLNHHSSVLVNESNESVVWDCEYCGKVNADLDTTDWKQPEHDDVTYLLEVPVKQDAKDITEDEHMVIFCIDISGSMSITTEVCPECVYYLYWYKDIRLKQ